MNKFFLAQVFSLGFFMIFKRIRNEKNIIYRLFSYGKFTLCTRFSQPVEITQQDINIQNEMSDASTKDITPKSIEDFLKNLPIISV